MKTPLQLIWIVVSVLLFSAGTLYADGKTGKKPLDHSVYNQWSHLGGYAITSDGKYAAFYENKEENDGKVTILGLASSTESYKLDIERGSRFKLTADDSHLVCIIRPEYLKQKEARIKKLKGDKAPKDTLFIVNFRKGKSQKFPVAKSFEIPKDGGDFIAFIANDMSDSTKKSALFIYNLKRDVVVDTLYNVDTYDFTDSGKLLVYNKKEGKGKSAKSGVYVRDLVSGETVSVIEGGAKVSFMKPVISDDEQMLAFYANTDTTKKADENVEIFTYKVGAPKALKVIDNSLAGLEEGMVVSKNRALNFSKDNGKLFFGVMYELPQKDTTLPDSEKAKLDVWHFNDTYISTQQLARVTMDKKRSYVSYIKLDGEGNICRGAFDADGGKRDFVRLAQVGYKNVVVPDDWSSSWAYSLTDAPYAYMSQWNADPLGDLYIIDVESGEAKMIVEGDYMTNVTPSPNGKYLVWYNPQKKDWFSYTLESGAIKNITEKIQEPLWDALQDRPQMPGAYGQGGWRESGERIFIYDKYDVWEVDPSCEADPVMLTQGKGKELGYTFKLIRLDRLQLPDGTPGIKKEPIGAKDTLFFTAFDNKSKGYGYFMRPYKGKKLQPMQQLIMEPDYQLGYLNRAQKGKTLTYVKSNFQEPANLHVTRDWFKSSKKLTDVNPQQREYNWGSCELVYWKGDDGRDLEGLLYKPEDFDPAKQYPMIVYFYEKTSQHKNTYRKPAVSRSTINVAYFVSNGYLVFMPDIHYVTGHPGKSAMNCIIPGVKKLCENSWVNSKKIAIQGQSWGGYQVAYMVTQTDMFACAGAGAPVANMTSAYGGIRWGSGVVRQFQYEHTQSRIGCTLWDEGGLELYIENSPLFFADKMNTPLLIMHNDKDEAVPWTQGIEFFTALKRLGKKNVWMLQYNGESHNLSNKVNALDYTIRLGQFMDHFLKDKPMPVWMKYGIPATKKGVEYGLEIAD